MFLAFFPIMLLVLGVVATSNRLRGGVLEIVEQLGVVFPPGAELVQFLTRPGQDTWAGGFRWVCGRAHSLQAPR